MARRARNFNQLHIRQGYSRPHSMPDDDDYKPSTGRFARLAKLASLSAKLSTDVVSRGVKRFASKAGDDQSSLLGAGAAEKLVATLGDLKGLAMKIGQSLAMDPDLLTPEIRAVVARLQNQAPPMPWSTVREVVSSQLGRPVEEAYASFEQTALASASLGQVHRAVLHDGAQVAVKVQYPDIAKALVADLDNLGAMVLVVAASTRISHGREYYAEMRDALLDELDYRTEAKRLHLYEHAVHGFEALRVPRVFETHTAAKVLTLELLEGVTLKEFLHHKSAHSAQEKFAASRLLIFATWLPFLNEGVVHADPHPGNFMLLSDGRLGVFDFGAVKQLSDPWLRANRRLFGSFFGGPPYDVIGESIAAGMMFDAPEAARPFVQTVLDIACRAVKGHDFDYNATGINRDLRAHMLRHALMLPKIRPPKEALQFFRGVAGMSQNLENIGARGDFRAVFQELYDAAKRLGRPLEGGVDDGPWHQKRVQ